MPCTPALVSAVHMQAPMPQHDHTADHVRQRLRGNLPRYANKVLACSKGLGEEEREREMAEQVQFQKASRDDRDIEECCPASLFMNVPANALVVHILRVLVPRSVTPKVYKTQSLTAGHSRLQS